MKQLTRIFKQAKPYLAAIVLRFLAAGLVITSKIALNKGMNPQVYLVYRYCIATIVVAPFAFVFERKGRPKMTSSIFAKIVLLGSMESILIQNAFFTGLKYATSTFSVAMSNIVPAFVFLIAWIFMLEKVNIRRLESQTKLLGTAVVVGGATIMTLVRARSLSFPGTEGHFHHHSSSAAKKQDSTKGVVLVTAACVCSSASCILQAITLKSYPAGLSRTAFVSLVVAMESAVLALTMEWNNPAAWSIHLYSELVAILYAGIASSGLSYYVQGVVMEEKGPVFLTAFYPLSVIIVAIISSSVFSEILFLGKVLGAVIIIIGLYLVLWGKSKDPIHLASDKVASSENKMAATNEGLETEDQEHKALHVAKVRTRDDSV